MDPFGTNPYESQRNPANFPFPIVAGQPLAYRVDMGNITVLMLSDRNELGAPAGRQGVSSFGGGGRPAGAITEETFLWWKAQVTQAKAEGRIVLTAAHHVLRETTAWSGDYGGQKLVNGQWTGWIHGYDPAGVDNEGASYLYWFVHPDGSVTSKALAFETYLAANSGAIDLWIGAHSHSDPRVPDAAGRTHLETRWGTHFIQAAGLTRYHVDTSYPRSVLLTFTEGSTTVLVRPYWHSTRAGAVGWDTERQRTLTLATPFVYPVGYDGPGSVVNPYPCATPAPTPTATPSACPTPTPSPDSIPPAV